VAIKPKAYAPVVLPFPTFKRDSQVVLTDLMEKAIKGRIEAMTIVASVKDDEDVVYSLMYPLVADEGFDLRIIESLISNLAHAQFKLLTFLEENTTYGQEDSPSG